MLMGWAVMFTSNVDGGREELQCLGVKFAVGGGGHSLVGAVLSLPYVWEEPASGRSPTSRVHRVFKRARLSQDGIIRWIC